MWFVLLLCIIAAFADVVGGALTVVRRLHQEQMVILSGLGAGFLLGATLLDRLPDAMQELPQTAPLYIIIGYLALLLVERFGAGGHHTHSLDARTPIHNPPSHRTGHGHLLIQPKAALVSFFGLLFHTFMDGVIIAGAFSINRATGLLIFFAIAMHKVPEGFSMATISLAAGTSRRRAFMTALALAISTLAGALVTLRLGMVDVPAVKVLMALATGTFLFIATSDMIPAIREQRPSAIVSVLAGAGLFYLSLVLIHHVGLT